MPQSCPREAADQVEFQPDQREVDRNEDGEGYFANGIERVGEMRRFL